MRSDVVCSSLCRLKLDICILLLLLSNDHKEKKKNFFCEFISINILFRLKLNLLWRELSAKFFFSFLFIYFFVFFSFNTLHWIVEFPLPFRTTFVTVCFICSKEDTLEVKRISESEWNMPWGELLCAEKVSCVKIHCRNWAETLLLFASSYYCSVICHVNVGSQLFARACFSICNLVSNICAVRSAPYGGF